MSDMKSNITTACVPVYASLELLDITETDGPFKGRALLEKVEAAMADPSKFELFGQVMQPLIKISNCFKAVEVEGKRCWVYGPHALTVDRILPLSMVPPLPAPLALPQTASASFNEEKRVASSAENMVFLPAQIAE